MTVRICMPHEGSCEMLKLEDSGDLYSGRRCSTMPRESQGDMAR
jgi:hypothetical protein